MDQTDNFTLCTRSMKKLCAGQAFHRSNAGSTSQLDARSASGKSQALQGLSNHPHTDFECTSSALTYMCNHLPEPKNTISAERFLESR